MNAWRQWTQARVGLGRQGSSLPTAEFLNVLEAQALARDSLWRPWDPARVAEFLEEAHVPCLRAKTLVQDRQQYLMRPDLGRQLSQESAAVLQGTRSELVFCVTDGLATDAIEKQLIPFLQIFLPLLERENFYHGQSYPFVLIPLARVATADAVAWAMNSRLSVMFVGERPGLSAHDSMGIYLTYEPAPGTLDSRRNCISNVRTPDGLSYELAARQLLYLMRTSLRLQLSGVGLKLEEKDLIESSGG